MTEHVFLHALICNMEPSFEIMNTRYLYLWETTKEHTKPTSFHSIPKVVQCEFSVCTHLHSIHYRLSLRAELKISLSYHITSEYQKIPKDSQVVVIDSSFRFNYNEMNVSRTERELLTTASDTNNELVSTTNVAHDPTSVWLVVVLLCCVIWWVFGASRLSNSNINTFQRLNRHHYCIQFILVSVVNWNITMADKSIFFLDTYGFLYRLWQFAS